MLNFTALKGSFLKTTHRRFAALIFAASVATIAGCSSSSNDAADSNNSTKEAISIQNCGREVTVDAPVERIVSLNQGTTEILLSLGLADRMVGTATWTDPVLDNLAEENEKVERLADNNAANEVVLNKTPDLVTASFATALSEGGSGTYEDFQKVGVPAYLAYTDCLKAGQASSDGKRDTKLTKEDIFHDITDIATLTQTEDAGTKLVDQLNTRIAATKPVEKETKVAFWFASAESPYMAGGFGAPQLIADQLNLTNVFADHKDEWPQINWEAVAEADPDVLVIGDLTRKAQTAETAEQKIEFLKNNPVTSEMTAVKNDRFIAVAGGDMNPSIRTVDGMEKVSAGLTELNLR